jgi:hypothetical protein
MQPGIRIYLSTVHWRLNMFQAAYRSSSVALTVFAASVYVRMWWPAVVKSEWEQLELLMSGVPLETCSAFKEWWNNKF